MLWPTCRLPELQGWRFQHRRSLDADLLEFSDEHLIEYEIGYKSMMMDDRVALQIALFTTTARTSRLKAHWYVFALITRRRYRLFGNAFRYQPGTEINAGMGCDRHAWTGLRRLAGRCRDDHHEFGEDLLPGPGTCAGLHVQHSCPLAKRAMVRKPFW